MAYCHECGEEVAEIDSFCPHCGISLKPLVLDNEPDLESTIAISPEEIARTFPGELSADPQTSFESEASTEMPEENLMPRFGQSSLHEADAEPEHNTEPAEPEPAEPIGSFPEELPFTAEVEQDSSDESDISNDLEPEEEIRAGEEIPEPIDEQTLTPEPDAWEQSAAVEPDLAASSPEFTEDIDQSDYFSDSETGDLVEDEDSLVESALEDFAPSPDLSADFNSQEMTAGQDTSDGSRNEPHADVVPEIEHGNADGAGVRMKQEVVEYAEDSAEVEREAVESQTDAPPADPFSAQSESSGSDSENDVPVPAILKPEFEPTSDEEKAPSRFDSVSIMERNEDEAAESSGSPSEEAAAADEPIESEPEIREARQFTSPNMNGPDTDGKKSKLKPLDEGTILNNRYEIVRKIGGGGMGAVYLASDKNLGGVLRAVKEMVQSYIEETQQEKAVNDFKRESMLLTSLEHSAIPTIYDYFYDEKEARFYLVMKYINGGDLSSRLRATPEGRIDELTVVEWAIQVADVLDYLHKRQPPIVYRDLKPANIMIDGNSNKIMLIDFGIARWINKEEKGVTAVGTMGYAPPELFSGNVEPRSDIYSLGSTMFHLLTGADPQSNPLLIFDFQKNPRPRQINPQLSDQIEAILMRAVEYNADKRFASTAELRRALEEHFENLKANRVTFGVKESPKAVTLSDEKVFCGFCGQSIVASDLFCAFCGAKQPIAQKGVHRESYSSIPVTARLTIVGTNELESPSYTIDKQENLVGRRDPMSNIFPEIDLSKFDPQTKISRRHARIWRDGNKFMVEDLGSSNGTILLPVVSDARRLVPNQPHILTNGDRLKMGDTTLHFVIG